MAYHFTEVAVLRNVYSYTIQATNVSSVAGNCFLHYLYAPAPSQEGGLECQSAVTLLLVSISICSAQSPHRETPKSLG